MAGGERTALGPKDEIEKVGWAKNERDKKRGRMRKSILVVWEHRGVQDVTPQILKKWMKRS
jgi:hypothetical protein